MLLKKSALTVLACSLLFGAGVTLAADQVKDQTQDKTQIRDQIYGSQLMTEQERIEHRLKIRSLKTAKEREAYQLEHHKRMQERAKEKGVTLPSEPSIRSGGMGPGNLGSGGMRSGGGK